MSTWLDALFTVVPLAAAAALGLYAWYRVDRRAAYRAREELVRERELFVARGCPRIEYDELTGKPGLLVGNPFLGDTVGSGYSIESFPDLAHRNAVAEALYRRDGERGRLSGHSNEAIERARAQPWPELESAEVGR